MPDIRAESINEIHLEAFQGLYIAEYHSAEEYPGKYVARIYAKGKPTNIVVIKDTQEELEEELSQTGMTIFSPGAEDMPQLIGVWM